jgi:HD-GYP domain-containing protein (c-di-GMP phosphodiesterase class II)
LASGVEVAYEPMSDAAPRLARKRRAIARRRVPRRGWSHDRVRSLVPSVPEMAGCSPEDIVLFAGAASPALSYAYLASDVEDLMKQLGIGLALDVPRAVEAALSAIESVYATPHRMVIDAIGTLSSGKLRDHTTASAIVATAVGRAIGLTQDDCLDVTVAALLHDMAMLWIREDLIAEQGPLGKAGRRAVRRHPARAFHMLADADGLAPTTALTSLAVHERSDGSGYPMGLRSAEILVPARLLAAVDVLCAVLAPRPHRGNLGGSAAMELCVRMAGEGALDGDAVRALLRAVGLYPLGSLVWLSTGELARVIATNGDQFERPVVAVVRTSSGLRPSEERLIDLAKLAGISITGAAE